MRKGEEGGCLQLIINNIFTYFCREIERLEREKEQLQLEVNNTKLSLTSVEVHLLYCTAGFNFMPTHTRLKFAS